MGKYDYQPPLTDVSQEGVLELNWASVQLRFDEKGVRFTYYKDGKWQTGPSFVDDPKAFKDILSSNLWYPNKWIDEL